VIGGGASSTNRVDQEAPVARHVVLAVLQHVRATAVDSRGKRGETAILCGRADVDVAALQGEIRR
jgi:hypothetical protein